MPQRRDPVPKHRLATRNIDALARRQSDDHEAADRVQRKHGRDIAITGNSVIVANGGAISSASQTGGNAGTISISTPSLTLNNGIITTSTSSSGNAGTITAKVDTLTLTNGAEISSNSTGDATGAAGSVTIQGLASPANAVTISVR